jgi:hypothetical protein
MKEKFYKVNDTHTFMLNKDKTIFYVGMEVQYEYSDTTKEFVMMFSPQQIIEMYDYMIKSVVDQSEK